MNGLIGQTVGGYQILAQIGKGGMAAVFKAYQPSLERYVAVKVLPPFYAEQDDTFVRRFKQEARAIANLRHPNILMVMDHGEVGGLTYIVMEYVEAGTLAELLGQPLDVRQMASLVGQVAAALDYAHGQGVVHRDIKPSNILLPKPDWPLLTDFGLAKIVGGTRITQSGTIAGTPAYMSPEQGRGERVDFHSDIYSLGIVLYEMATGAVPYEAETPMAVVVKHIIEPLPPPRSRNPELPESIERVILKALAKDPEDRYARATDFGEALRRAADEFASVGERDRQDRAPTPSQEPAPEAATLPPVAAGQGPGPAVVRLPPGREARGAAAPADRAASRPEGESRHRVPRLAWAGGVLAILGLAAVGLVALLRGPGAPAEVSSSSPQAGAESSEPDAQGSARTLDQMLADGRASMERGDPAAALADFEAALAKVPGSLEAMFEMARAQFALGDREAALGSVMRARETAPTDADVQESAGWTLYEMGLYPEAAEAFERVLELEPAALWIYESLVSLYMEQGRVDAAQETVHRAMEAGAEQDPDLLATLAWDFLEGGFLEQAESLFATLAERFPDRPDGLRGIAEIRYRQADLARAIETLGALLSRVPDQEAYEALGWWQWEAGEVVAAQEAFRHAIELDPVSATSAYGGLASLLVDQGRPAEAEELLRSAAAAHPQQADLQAELGNLLAWNLEQYETALPFFQAALELDPENGWRYSDLAEMHIALGAADPAAELLELAASHGPDDPWLADAIGWAYVDLGQCDLAVGHFRRALALDDSVDSSSEGLRTCGG